MDKKQPPIRVPIILTIITVVFAIAYVPLRGPTPFFLSTSIVGTIIKSFGIILSIVSLIWVIYGISSAIRRKDEKKANSISIQNNLPPQNRQMALDSIRANRSVIISICSSSATLIFTIITVIIIEQVQKRSPGVEVLVLFGYWYLFLIIVALEILSVILALLSSIRTKKIRKTYQNFIKQKKIYLIKKILFIIVLLWPLLYILAGVIFYPIINL